jgi:hypothetical protein
MHAPGSELSRHSMYHYTHIWTRQELVMYRHNMLPTPFLRQKQVLKFPTQPLPFTRLNLSNPCEPPIAFSFHLVGFSFSLCLLDYCEQWAAAHHHPHSIQSQDCIARCTVRMEERSCSAITPPPPLFSDSKYSVPSSSLFLVASLLSLMYVGGVV